jgi:hypothetical protein
LDADITKIDFIQEIKGLIAMLKEECAKAGRKSEGFDISTGAAPDLDMIKRIEDLGVTRVFMISDSSERDGITRCLENIGNTIIARL